ncbi:hypothetical protein V8G54_017099 [Vigna mungo]|uniref:Vitamin K epoxide reductase domain-containing protein n=1 Tax=Vigna mungo TaxID=3915 RepID=A0AAQ3NLG3_VIGMU
MVVLQFSGIPLPLIGMAAYGLVAALGLQLTSNKLRFGINKSTAQAVLLGATTSMAAASAYFLYTLTTRFSDSSCSYCLLSAFLSFTLFFVTLKDLGLQEVSKTLGLQLLVATIVILTLNTSYDSSKSGSSRLSNDGFLGSRTIYMQSGGLFIKQCSKNSNQKLKFGFQIQKLRSKKATLEMKFEGKAKKWWSGGKS